MIKIELQGKEYTFDNKDAFNIFLDKSNLKINNNGEIIRNTKVGCIPGILDLWFQKRVEYKDLMKKHGKEGDKAKYAFYGKRQLVQKILLNSLYGVLGLPAFRFYDIDNAEAVTTTGRTVIQSTADMANIKYNKELGGASIIIELENGTEITIYPNTPINVIRNGITTEILGKELVETDEFFI
jgi:hypothetical protein